MSLNWKAYPLHRYIHKEFLFQFFTSILALNHEEPGYSIFNQVFPKFSYEKIKEGINLWYEVRKFMVDRIFILSLTPDEVAAA